MNAVPAPGAATASNDGDAIMDFNFGLENFANAFGLSFHD
jgi:hypothetical protein